MTPPSQMTLRLNADALAALEAAQASVGSAIPLHRLTVLALTRGAREIAANPAVLFAAPPPKPSAAAAEPAAPIVEAAPPVAPVVPAAPLEVPTTKAAVAARKRPAAPVDRRVKGMSEENAERLERDLSAIIDGPTPKSARALAADAGVSASSLTRWRQARAAGERAAMSPANYRKLRKHIDKLTKGGKGR